MKYKAIIFSFSFLIFYSGSSSSHLTSSSRVREVTSSTVSQISSCLFQGALSALHHNFPTVVFSSAFIYHVIFSFFLWHFFILILVKISVFPKAANCLAEVISSLAQQFSKCQWGQKNLGWCQLVDAGIGPIQPCILPDGSPLLSAQSARLTANYMLHVTSPWHCMLTFLIYQTHSCRGIFCLRFTGDALRMFSHPAPPSLPPSDGRLRDLMHPCPHPSILSFQTKDKGHGFGTEGFTLQWSGLASYFFPGPGPAFPAHSSPSSQAVAQDESIFQFYPRCVFLSYIYILVG